MQQKINILYLIDTLKDGGGTETHLAHISAYLNRKRFSCLICVLDDNRGPFVEKIEANASVKYISVGRLYGVNAIFKAIKLMKFIRENKIDIVQTFHFKSDTYGVLVSKLAGVRSLISSRRDLGDLKKRRHVLLNRLLNPLVDHFIVVCNSVGETLKKVERVPSDKVTTVYNGVRLNAFRGNRKSQSIGLKRAMGIPDRAFVIGSIAYFRPEKGYDVFFEAIDKIRDSMNNWTVITLGDGPMEDHFRMLCRKKKIDCNVKFMGSVSDVLKYGFLMDIICLVPTQNEGFSNAILEGMAMGKPIIATDMGGNSEAIVDGDTGIIIPPNHPQKLADAIVRLYRDVNLRKRMGERGRERVEKHFTLEDTIMKLQQLYLQMNPEIN